MACAYCKACGDFFEGETMAVAFDRLQESHTCKDCRAWHATNKKRNRLHIRAKKVA